MPDAPPGSRAPRNSVTARPGRGRGPAAAERTGGRAGLSHRAGSPRRAAGCWARPSSQRSSRLRASAGSGTVRSVVGTSSTSSAAASGSRSRVPDSSASSARSRVEPVRRGRAAAGEPRPRPGAGPAHPLAAGARRAGRGSPRCAAGRRGRGSHRRPAGRPSPPGSRNPGQASSTPSGVPLDQLALEHLARRPERHRLDELRGSKGRRSRSRRDANRS